MESNSKPSLSLPLIVRLQLRIFSIATGAVSRPDFTVNRRLFNLLDRKTPADATPRGGVSTHDAAVDPARDLWFRLFLPTQATATSTTASPVPVVVFFHGGGFTFLGAAFSSYDALCRRLARRLGAAVVSVNYRLAPEHKFPAQYEDAIDVLRFLDDSGRRKSVTSWPENADVSRCFLVGDSAGGNIAHHAAGRASEERFSELRVIGSVVIQPFFAGKERSESEIRLERAGAPLVNTGRTEWLLKAFYPDGLDPDHWATNVCGLNARDLSGSDLPATVVVVGGFDPLQDWQRKYYWWLKKNGKEVKLVEFPNACHGFYAFPEVGESSALIDEINNFMRKQLS